jgi:hypothetical protein
MTAMYIMYSLLVLYVLGYLFLELVAEAREAQHQRSRSARKR